MPANRTKQVTRSQRNVSNNRSGPPTPPPVFSTQNLCINRETSTELPHYNPSIDRLTLTHPKLPHTSCCYFYARRDNSLRHTLHHPNPPCTTIVYITRIICRAQLRPTTTNTLAIFNWDPVTLPALSTLHTLAYVASQLPTAYRNVTLRNLMHLATQETHAYHQQYEEDGGFDNWMQLIHTVSVQELWREWSSAGTAQSGGPGTP